MKMPNQKSFYEMNCYIKEEGRIIYYNEIISNSHFKELYLTEEILSSLEIIIFHLNSSVSLHDFKRANFFDFFRFNNLNCSFQRLNQCISGLMHFAIQKFLSQITPQPFNRI